MELDRSLLSTLPDFLTPEMLSSVLPVSRSTLYRALHQGTIPCMRIGKRFILSRAHLERWLEDNLYHNEVCGSWRVV